MSAGKIAAQSFQAAQRLFAVAEDDGNLAALLSQWQQQGTCTRTRIALSPTVFERACRELPGALMIDEGVTEVEPGSATCFATYPLDENDLPQVLSHKRIPVLNAVVNHTSFRRPADVAQWQSSGFNSPSVEGSNPSVCVPPAREAEMDQHRQPTGNAEVAGSMPASGTWPLGPSCPGAPQKASGLQGAKGLAASSPHQARAEAGTGYATLSWSGESTHLSGDDPCLEGSIPSAGFLRLTEELC